jgi:hypothetical protein
VEGKNFFPLYVKMPQKPKKTGYAPMVHKNERKFAKAEKNDPVVSSMLGKNKSKPIRANSNMTLSEQERESVRKTWESRYRLRPGDITDLDEKKQQCIEERKKYLGEISDSNFKLAERLEHEYFLRRDEKGHPIKSEDLKRSDISKHLFHRFIKHSDAAMPVDLIGNRKDIVFNVIRPPKDDGPKEGVQYGPRTPLIMKSDYNFIRSYIEKVHGCVIGKHRQLVYVHAIHLGRAVFDGFNCSVSITGKSRLPKSPFLQKRQDQFNGDPDHDVDVAKRLEQNSSGLMTEQTWVNPECYPTTDTLSIRSAAELSNPEETMANYGVAITRELLTKGDSFHTLYTPRNDTELHDHTHHHHKFIKIDLHRQMITILNRIYNKENGYDFNRETGIVTIPLPKREENEETAKTGEYYGFTNPIQEIVVRNLDLLPGTHPIGNKHNEEDKRKSPIDVVNNSISVPISLLMKMVECMYYNTKREDFIMDLSTFEIAIHPHIPIDNNIVKYIHAHVSVHIEFTILDTTGADDPVLRYPTLSVKGNRNKKPPSLKNKNKKNTKKIK